MSQRANHGPFGPVTVGGRHRSDERNASVLRYLREQVEPVHLSELAAEIVREAREAEGVIHEDGDADPLGRVQVRLHHVDLPKMDDAGVLDYDAERRVASLPDERRQETPPLDSTLELLARRERRYALECVGQHHRMAMVDLAREVAEREFRGRDEEAPVEAVERIHVSLSHVHVPKLEDAGAIRYDRERDLVTASEGTEPLLSLCRRLGDVVDDRLGASATDGPRRRTAIGESDE